MATSWTEKGRSNGGIAALTALTCETLAHYVADSPRQKDRHGTWRHREGEGDETRTLTLVELPRSPFQRAVKLAFEMGQCDSPNIF